LRWCCSEASLNAVLEVNGDEVGLTEGDYRA